jgi:hypothetical protein
MPARDHSRRLLLALFTAGLAGGCALIDASGDGTAGDDGDDSAADCRAIVSNAFDDTARWGVYSEPGTSVERSPDTVQITAAPAEEDYSAYADLRSNAQLAIGETRLEAMVAPGAQGSVAGISWTQDDPAIDEDQDYYDLVVDFGTLIAARRDPFGEHEVICTSECQPYHPVAHAWFRLRADRGEVFYEVSPDGVDWSEIARAPLTQGVYRSMAFVYAAAPDTSALSVTEMAWSTCEN